MSDDDQTPEQEPKLPATPLERIVERVLEGGLPEVIAGPAGKAISRLIGGAADIPAAWFEQKAQAIRDETAARSQMVKALGAAVSKNAIADPALLERAQDSWLGKAYRSQANREAIAVETVKLLAEEPPTVGAVEPEADWMNIFESFAENASSEKLRSTWAQVLAGEIRKPKSFSLKTLQFISTLDADTASNFGYILPQVANGGQIFAPMRFDYTEDFAKLLSLRESGLLGETVSNRMPTIQGHLLITYIGYAITVDVGDRLYCDLTNIPLTRVGGELYEILKSKPSEALVSLVASHIANIVSAECAFVTETAYDRPFQFGSGTRVPAAKT